MGLIALIALIVVILAVLAAVGNVAYLALLNSAANKRGASGSAVSQYVKSRWPVAGVTSAGAVLAWLLSSGTGFVDVLAIVVGGVSGAIAGKSLTSTMERYRSES